MEDVFNIKRSQLRGYLREFYVKPDMSTRLWDAVKCCMDDTKNYAFGVKFADDLSMKQFCMAVLLSSGKQFSWSLAKSYAVLQDNLAGTVLLGDYNHLDILFIEHARGTMRNGIFGQTINQVAILRSPKKTFFLDRGGPAISDLFFPVVSSLELYRSSGGKFSGDDAI